MNMINNLVDDQRVFDFPKAVPLIIDIIRFANVGSDDIVLRRFSGRQHANLQQFSSGSFRNLVRHLFELPLRRHRRLEKSFTADPVRADRIQSGN